MGESLGFTVSLLDQDNNTMFDYSFVKPNSAEGLAKEIETSVEKLMCFVESNMVSSDTSVKFVVPPMEHLLVAQQREDK